MIVLTDPLLVFATRSSRPEIRPKPEIAAKSRLRPVSPSSYVGQGRKKHKKEDEEKLTQSRKGAKVKTKTNR